MNTVLAAHHLARYAVAGGPDLARNSRWETYSNCAPLGTDLISRIGVIVGVTGAAIAAPDATALVAGWLGTHLRAAMALLPRVISFLRRDANVLGTSATLPKKAHASAAIRVNFGISAEGMVWNPGHRLTRRLSYCTSR